MRSKRIAEVVLHCAGIGVLSIPLWAQRPSDLVSGMQDVTLENVHLVSRGEVLSRGMNELPTGKLRVKSYRLERIKLSHPVTASTQGEYDYVLRFVVTGQRFSNSNFTIWMDDRPFPARPSRDFTEIRADFLNGPNILENGAALAISEGGPCDFREGNETVLPERFSVPENLRAAPFLGALGSSLRFQMIHRDTDVVRITLISGDVLHSVRSRPAFLQLGKSRYLPLVYRDGSSELSAEIPAADFAHLPYAALVYVAWGRCEGGGEFVGRMVDYYPHLQLQ